ncbi:LysR family transcriptional regulator [Tunicatimonas pelagia]|uniref:LysR family transcriptional regulator n=1 Tax=Tunicatimonas pelagia TaxID=931531 RepID=UPI00266573BA|nr:LysR family transcriptional regulator [Tunicatimonas pelagia]WKN42695.1 LysR family transcriptional regulator [Tunicatimonas pelagia]
MVNSNAISYFKALAQKLNFTETAQYLGITQPPLTRAIQKLEEDLGFNLFTRTNRKVELTQAGAVLYEYVIRSEKLFNDGIEHSKAVSKGKVGLLKISYVGSSMQSILPATLQNLVKAYPNVNLKLYEQTSAQTISQVLSGSIDLGIIRGSIHDNRLVKKSIFSERYALLTPIRTKITKIEEIDKIIGKEPNFVSFERPQGQELYSDIALLFERLNIQPKIQHRANHLHSIVKLVEIGLGSAVIPKSAIDNLNVKVNIFEIDESFGKSILNLVALKHPKKLTQVGWEFFKNIGGT